MEMSYQNSSIDSLPTVQKSESKAAGSFLWKFITLVSVFGAVGLFGYSASSYGVQQSTQVRLELAKTGGMRYSSLLDEEKTLLFQQFKSSFNKKYASPEEESERLENFKTFLEKVDVRNQLESLNGGTATHGITKFADLGEEEFKARSLGYQPPKERKLPYKTVTAEDYDLPPKSTGIVNWFGVLTTAVKDQGYCGSCWAFSAASQIESDAIRAGYLTTDDELSEQQIVSCDQNSYGCDGGSTEAAYYYVYENGGLLPDTDYPYTSYYYSETEKTTCLKSSTDYSVTIDDYYSLDSEATMKAHILTTGPLSVCLDATSWSSYTSGVVSSCGNDVDHCVQLVGINTEESYWIVRNSWGTEWGVDGFIYLKYGTNTCDITNDPTYVEVVKI